MALAQHSPTMSVRDSLIAFGLVKSDAEKARASLPIVPIASATDERGKMVHVRGRVEAVGDPVMAQFSGRDVVWCVVEHRQLGQLSIEGQSGRNEVEVWREMFRSGAASTFDVVDESGLRARVMIGSGVFEANVNDPLTESAAPTSTNATWRERRGGRIALETQGVTFELPAHAIDESARLNDMPADLDRFFRKRGVIPTQFMAMLQRENQFREATIDIGATVEVIGEAEVGRDDRNTGYRDGERIVVIRPKFVVVD